MSDLPRVEDSEIVFRRLDNPVPAWSVPGCRWVVEYWQLDMAYPVGQAWVYAATDMAVVDWIHVQEQCRRLGIGSRLLDAIRRHWPEVSFVPVTPSGEQFFCGYHWGDV